MAGLSVHDIAEAMIKAARTRPDPQVATAYDRTNPDDLLKDAGSLVKELRAMAVNETAEPKAGQTLAEKIASLATDLPVEDRQVAQMLERLDKLRGDASEVIKRAESLSTASKGEQLMRKFALYGGER